MRPRHLPPPRRCRSTVARTGVERSLEAVEGYVRDFAEDNPHVNVALLRFSNVIGADIETPLSRALDLPYVPSLAGFDPRFQFVHEDDVVRSILYVLRSNLSGVYNVAGDGLLPWTEVATLCGKLTFPLPPLGTSELLWPFKRAGVVDLPEEYLNLLRFGRGVDNRKLKAILEREIGRELPLDDPRLIRHSGSVEQLAAYGLKPAA